MESIISNVKDTTSKSIKVYKICIGKSDQLMISYDDYEHGMVTYGPSGTYVRISTSEYKETTVRKNKNTLFSHKIIWTKVKVPVLRDVPVYAAYDGKCFYEMITGRELKPWDENIESCDFNNYVYYDHVLPVSDLSVVVEDIKFVKSTNPRIEEYKVALHICESKARDVKKEEIRKKTEEDTARQYLISYQRPNG